MEFILWLSHIQILNVIVIPFYNGLISQTFLYGSYINIVVQNYIMWVLFFLINRKAEQKQT